MKSLGLWTGTLFVAIIAMLPSLSRSYGGRDGYWMSEQPGTWSTPAPWAPAGGAPPTMRFSNGVVRNDSVLLAGNDIPNLFEIPKVPSPPVLFQNDRRLPSPVPAGTAVIQPRIASAGNGAVGLLWSVPSADESVDHPLTWISAGGGGIWSAEFREASGWSMPNRVVADAVQWSKSFSDGMSRGGDISVMVVPSSPTSGSFRGIHCLIWRDHTWTDSRISGILTAGEASAAIADGRIYVMFIGSEAQEHGTNSLYLVTSADLGRTWSSPQLLLAGGQQPIRHPRLRVSRKGVVGFFSRPSLNGGQAVGFVEIPAKLPATGSTRMSEAGGSVQAMQVVFDECDTAHLVYEDYQMNGLGALTYLTWNGSGWTKPARIFSGWRAIDPSLSISRGTLNLHFLGQSSDAPRRTPYASFESRYRTSCAK